MRLRKIKLSGFKSFVDPTTLNVPGNLCAIVGPNGCGKSNVIDAVTWVMGESSAKHLRGDSLTDVIFNGSSTRQPVGQASVELIFDNSEGKVGGQYASYSEISIRRQINRESISTYYLNGTRCRRKDIQGIFLGTGLGPRSYAIIEQGVISRLIEAKPEELRTFIEEAAGISKFRERRRETEHRMRHTRDNLDRLNDIRSELETQLSHLQRQARAAERYQDLKKEERRLRAELLALNWRGLKAQATERESTVRMHENRVEEAVAGLRRIEAGIESGRSDLAGANEAYNAAQSAYYEVGAQISQLEQKIQHGKERIQSLAADLAKARDGREAAESQQAEDRASLKELGSTVESLQPRLAGSRSESDEAYDALNQAERAQQGWQAEWETINEAIAEASRTVHADEARLEHLEEDIAESRQRREALNAELASLDPGALRDRLDEITRDAERLQPESAAAHKELDAMQAELRRERERCDELERALGDLRAEQQAVGEERAGLEALHRLDNDLETEPVRQWLEAAGLASAPRLARQLDVDPDWALAVEAVLGRGIHDLCVTDMDKVMATLKEFPRGRIGLVAAKPAPSGEAGGERRMLADLVAAPAALARSFAGVHAADSLAEALRLRPSLKEGESVVTRDGVWLGQGWVRIHRPGEAGSDDLSAGQQLQGLTHRQEQIGAKVRELEEELEARRAARKRCEDNLLARQQDSHAAHEQLTAMREQQAETRTRVEDAEQRVRQIEEEIEQLQLQQESDESECTGLRNRVERRQSELDDLNAQRDALAKAREKHRRALDEARSRWQSTHEQSHEFALRLESLSSRRASLEQALRRSDLQIASLDQNIAEIETNLQAARAPLPDIEADLEGKLAARVDAERALTDARARVQEIEATLRESEQSRSAAEQNIEQLRSELESARLAGQEIRVRLQTLDEQLQSMGERAEALLEGIEGEASAEAWTERLERVERRINRLGPINLAAIDEFTQLSERKTYLDRQNEDLTEALSTLENAIRKIDRETRTRFKETFDRLNDNLKEMFPKLFGGGHAYLELTGDDLLETGVAIMARPPGKRNTTIHLLSGGEKALTAVSLVFAIFKLNPAPFCILDEVDAPLDDTNVGRFRELLRTMSSDVQFVVITHNKITMEIAEQLLGVTMQEAGVSRLVSVDMDEAMQLAESA